MKLLLDTNVLLWLASGNTRLGSDFLKVLDSAEIVFVSDITLLEISIKKSIGKLYRPESFTTVLETLDAERLHVTDAALLRLETLPLLHRDPFDRALVAQAISEHAVLATGNKQLAAYHDVETIIV